MNIKKSSTLTPEDGQPLLIAGPCSVESEEQVMKTAMALKEYNIDILRGGIWKPRTRPNAFEGIGGRGLGWLKKAGAAAELPVGTEVAVPMHVEICLSHEIDVLWIGARTTANPFSVQAIADALKGVDIPVMVKNPVSPDLGLWIGALERLHNAGITQLAAIHRGFSMADDGKYRNRPSWHIPIELKRRMPDLPIICDPSHICGKRELLQHVSQEAIDLLFDGLMIEVHPDPDNAMSDNEQQLTPEGFGKLIASLESKKESVDDPDFQKQLSIFRENIDTIDSELIKLLGKRMQIVEEIGKFKKSQKVTVFQPSRWEEILKSRVDEAAKYNLSPAFMKQIYQFIHEEAVRHQEED